MGNLYIYTVLVLKYCIILKIQSSLSKSSTCETSLRGRGGVLKFCRVAGRPKAALLFWFFGDFRCGVPLLIDVKC